jgi:hypothetical protein
MGLRLFTLDRTGGRKRRGAKLAQPLEAKCDPSGSLSNLRLGVPFDFVALRAA